MNGASNSEQQWAMLHRELLRRHDAGEDLDRDLLAAKFPQFAERMHEFFDRQLTRPGNADDTETLPVDSGRPGSLSRGLHIRCPHCSNSVEILADTPYAEVGCLSCGSMFSLVDREEATSEAAALRTIGRFELISRLGLGGFGTVWKARDTELDRVVAIKIPRKGRLTPAEIEQFFREARAAAQLRHPNIVPVHEVGRERDTLYIVCDLVRGVELGDWLTGKTPSAREAAELCQKVALALHHAHEAGIVHRDLKPSNIMMDEESEPHLMDFGLAKREVGEITMTVDGHILGTPAYMSPEQAGGHAHWTDRRTDIYSLGVLMFRVLTGELPFRGNAQMQVHQRLTEDAPDPRKLNKNIQSDLSTICLKCLERDPNRRYSSARVVAEELGRYLRGEPIEARPLSKAARVARWAKRKPALAAIAGLVLFLAVAGPAAAWRIDGQRRRLAELVVEKDALIARSAGDKQRTSDQIAELSQELDLWKGKRNPWELWPPEPRSSPRLRLLGQLHRDRYAAMAGQLERGSYSDWEKACGHLALGMLASGVEKTQEVVAQLTAARELLHKLSKQDPAATEARIALARCSALLARTLVNAEPAKAKRFLAEASQTLAELALAGVEVDRTRVEQFDLEMRTVVAAGFDGGEAHLDEATKLESQITKNWPRDPVALYELVRFLSGEAPADH